MNIGMIGLGKLGLPCAMSMENKGHNVIGHDISPIVDDILSSRILPYREEGSQELLNKTRIRNASVAEVVSHSDIIFVAVQTPHEPKYEGITRLPEERVDFDYSYLIAACENLFEEIKKQQKRSIIAIVSTVLPGTIEREIKPLSNEYVKLAYNAQFIAMGTTRYDFENPEFVLLGVDDKEAANKVEEFYKTIHDAPVHRTSVKTAEAIKVAYNTFITTKICVINTWMEICHKIGADIDDITKAFLLATDRLISGKYLTAGHGDGGGCHCRDNIALSYIAQKLDLSFDWFENLMLCREKQTEWIANLAFDYNFIHNMPITILGRAFKPETELEVGSPSVLLANLLEEKLGKPIQIIDPYIDSMTPILDKRIYVIGTKHAVFKEYSFPNGSIVIDPWRYIPDQEGVKVIRIGEGEKHQQ